MVKLSRRMQLIYDHLLSGEPVWDFCCDHGYMGLNAYESGSFPEVHFVDQVEHIVGQLQSRFQSEYLRPDSTSRAYFHALPGEDLQEVLRGTAVIAGVGAHTIHKIVGSLYRRELLLVSRLILCPQRDEEKLVKMLDFELRDNFKLCNVHYEVVERGRVRKLLIFDKND
ncbi:SAM-dependent methyltransferase [Bdellovibrio sp.]|uniref:SAM-dependent methyltransferase n=1 Tax=Bdellovibrio sp. TaxID=28201 RepID=UPI0039E57305